MEFDTSRVYGNAFALDFITVAASDGKKKKASSS